MPLSSENTINARTWQIKYTAGLCIFFAVVESEERPESTAVWKEVLKDLTTRHCEQINDGYFLEISIERVSELTIT